ncbi:ATP-dependent helicase HrpB [Alloalcanivorax mobilis]|uniref:ATP-dependent helicase HrpB n=1 Tax=Alloalcanivorax mobilis TaxID=2019569 RepID=UPI000B5B2A16|nr:ATP-dependent helicase HrpB [Alloalcanivorax mobilis]ASK33987.1 ATP-dependent helicase HrpB [Alcanivorax sp. N3-2A]|tara:strand:+ start:15250 stop:17676 length:2427 start_codon:yes stop_codon:yes gene_type:complete
MSLLPVDTILPELLRCLAECGGAVLEAPPGAGKSTRVPLALLAAPWRGDGKILLLEPRRVAARAVAAFMAERLGEPVGATVGYRTRLDSRVSHATVIEVVTEGVLTRLMLDDPSLEGYAAVLFDEFHERSLQADLGLALVQEVRQALRGELRLLVMSATLEVGPLAEGLALPVVRSEGRVHPVTVSHAPPPDSRRWLEHCAAQVRALAGQGTVLVFLPGVGEIDRLGALLADLPMPVETLHGRLQGDAQAAVLRNVEGQARVVLSTNVAETSVTIEGVTTVLDSGLERRPDYDPRRQRSRLVTRRISEASAAQRAGRAGRLGPGRCVRLWSRDEVLARRGEAEIRQVGLEGLVLDLARWGCRDPAELFWLDPPPAGAWAAARQRLQRLGALGADGAISEWGARLAQLPLPPELAALVWLGREQGLPLSAARLAVLLSEPAPGLDREPDLAVRLNRFAERSGDWPALHQVTQRLLANRAARDRAEPLAGAGGLLAQAFPDRLARRREGEAPRYLLADGSGARLPPGSALGTRAWLVVLETDGDPREANIRLAWALDEQQARRCLDERGVWEERVAWDNGAQRVRARRVLTLGAIEVDSQPLQQPSAEQIQAGLLDGVRQQGLEALPWTPALRQWRARVGWMARLEPRQWPDTSDQALLANLEQWLGPFLAGLRSLRDLRKVALADALGLLLGPGQRQTLERQLPAGVAVASGRTAMIRYDNEGSPRLAVKLQECFGMRALPALAEGRVPLVVELLTPAGRPAAITADLEHFWRHGYPQVRKALRGRYPKHPWPDDPFSAVATSASKRRQ